MQSNKKFMKVLAYILIPISILYISSFVHLPLPEEEKGRHEISGSINTCEVFIVGRSGENTYGVHITLKNQNEEKMFSYNFNGEKLGYYNSLCNTKPVVKLSYYANRLFIRPKITYWLFSEPEIEDSKSVI